MALIVNLYGGPGTGKSTMAADIFSKLKWNGINCELVAEYAKDKVWEKSLAVLENQIYVFGKQHQRLFRLKNQVDVVVTDSPLLLSIIYDAKQRLSFKQLVIEEFVTFDNMNFILKRTKPYNPIGRLQTEDEAKGLDVKVESLLHGIGVEFETIPGTPEGVNMIVQTVMERLKKEQ